MLKREKSPFTPHVEKEQLPIAQLGSHIPRKTYFCTVMPSIMTSQAEQADITHVGFGAEPPQGFSLLVTINSMEDQGNVHCTFALLLQAF